MARDLASPVDAHAPAWTPGDVGDRFRELAELWRRETAYESSPTSLFMHGAYQEIIGMGPAVLPLIFSDLQANGSSWFWALRAITGENPVPAEERGNVPRMTERWLEWGRARGLA